MRVHTINYTLCKPSVCLFNKSQLNYTLSLSANIIYGADCIWANKLCVLVKQRKTQGTCDVIRSLVRFTDLFDGPLNLAFFVFLPGYGALAGIGYPGARPGKWWIRSYLTPHYFFSSAPICMLKGIFSCYKQNTYAVSHGWN